MFHIPISLAIQLALYLLGFGLEVGAAAGSFYFIGREYAQAEYRLIEHHYGSLRANMPTLAPLKDPRAWTQKSVFDWVLPTMATCAVAYLCGVR